MRVYAATNIWSAKSCPYETEINPASHVPNSWIATSDTNHYLVTITLYDKFRQSIISNLCYKNISILQFSHKTSPRHKVRFMIFQEFMQQAPHVRLMQTVTYFVNTFDQKFLFNINLNLLYYVNLCSNE